MQQCFQGLPLSFKALQQAKDENSQMSKISFNAPNPLASTTKNYLITRYNLALTRICIPMDCSTSAIT